MKALFSVCILFLLHYNSLRTLLILKILSIHYSYHSIPEQCSSNLQQKRKASLSSLPHPFRFSIFLLQPLLLQGHRVLHCQVDISHPSPKCCDLVNVCLSGSVMLAHVLREASAFVFDLSGMASSYLYHNLLKIYPPQLLKGYNLLCQRILLLLSSKQGKSTWEVSIKSLPAELREFC